MRRLVLAFLVMASAAVVLASQARGEPDVLYVPTPLAAVDAMLDVAQVKSTDVV